MKIILLSLALVSLAVAEGTKQPELQCFKEKRPWLYEKIYDNAFGLTFNSDGKDYIAYYRGSRELDDQRDQPLYYEEDTEDLFDSNNNFSSARKWLRTYHTGGKCAAINGDEVIMYRCNANGKYPTVEIRAGHIFLVDHEQKKYFRLYADTESKTIKAMDCGPESEMPKDMNEFYKRRDPTWNPK
jgi:hypothetical protein